MAQTFDVGRLYFHGLNYPFPGAPLVDRASTVEVEPPYRIGKGLCVRYTPHRALVVGWWGRATRDEQRALYGALKASDMDVTLDEILTWERPVPDVPGSPLEDVPGVRRFSLG